MNKYVKILIPAVVLIVLLAGAAYGYPYLSEKYGRQDADKIESGEKDEKEDTPVDADKEKSHDGQNEEEEGIPALDFSVLDEEGNRVNLSDYFGKPIVLNFWATWCGPCQQEMPYFDELYEEYKDQVDFLMVNLTDGSRDTVSGVKEFKQEQGYDFPIFFDTEYEGSYQYGVTSIPVTYFIRKDGVIDSYQVGAFQREEMLRGQIENLLR